jgi:hypothetical protein
MRNEKKGRAAAAPLQGDARVRGVLTVDVSSGGFCTETMLALPVGTMIQGSVQGPRKKVWFSGRIAWAEPGDCTLSLRGRMGIALADAGAELFGHRDAGVTP